MVQSWMLLVQSLRVTDVQRAPNGQALHTVEVEGELALNQEYKLGY